MEHPDLWKIVRIETKPHGTLFKVFSSFYGGYLGSDAWKISSRIKTIEDQGTQYVATTQSGNRYSLIKGNEGFSGFGRNVFEQYQGDLANSGLGSLEESSVKEFYEKRS